MKFRVQFLAVCLAIACASCAAPGKHQEQKAVLENYNSYPAVALAQRLKEAGQSASQEGSLLKVGQREIRIEPQIEREVQKEGRWLIGVGIRVNLDGNDLPALRSGAVGIDASREAALKTAAEEWSQEFGAPLVHALFPTSTKHNPAVYGAYRIFPGPPGIRGSDNIKSFDASLRELPDVLGRFATQTFHQGKAEWRGLTVSIAFTPTQEKKSMCQVDGKMSDELSSAVNRLDWPVDGNYLFKRFYLLAPAK